MVFTDTVIIPLFEVLSRAGKDGVDGGCCCDDVLAAGEAPGAAEGVGGSEGGGGVLTVTLDVRLVGVLIIVLAVNDSGTGGGGVSRVF